MSSTNEKRLRKFYQKKLVPTAARLHARGVYFFELGPNPEAESWYEPGPAEEPEFFTVEPEDCERRLRELWEGQGLPELAKLTRDLMKLAKQLDIEDEPSAELSADLYVMH